MSGQRISRDQLQWIAAHLTERDQEVIQMLATLKLATGNQLRRATLGDDSEAGRRAARRQLQRLVRWRVVARLERRQGGLGRGSDAWTYALDVAGQRLVATPSRAHRPHLPSRPMWAHGLLGAEVYTRLVEATRGTERKVRVWQGEPECWRDFGGSYGERLRLKPDAFVAVTGPNFEDVCFCEFDTGSQSRAVIRSKLAMVRRYAATGQEQAAQDGVFPLTVFVTTSLERHAVLVDLIGELPTEAWRLFAVGLVADAARLLTGGAS
jgi:hypothetical protein